MNENEFFRQPALVLVQIHLTNGEINNSKLAKKFEVYNGNMAKLISKLERLDLIQRNRSEKSKREVNISLTRKGKNIAESISKIRYNLI